ncbi:MAG: energy transducer TonB [Thermodesulfobacteriota bacterium]|nr:energy transducer TonB [Thermodesulfobacteriota bacterium]
MNGTWNLKLFVSISLGLHFFVLSLLSILLPDFKITRLPPLNIEVSLLPLVKEEREPLRKVEDKYKVRSKEEEPLRIVEKKETEIKSEPPVTSHEERKVPQVEKVEVTLPKKEPEPISSPSVQSEVRAVSVSEPKPSPLESEKREIESKKEERVIIASLGKPIPQVSPSEKSRVVMKGPSLSDSEIVFAQPRYAENPKPLYPREARKKGYEGEVLLRVEVLSNGRVGEIEVRRSSGYEVLDRSAITAVKQWRFVPAKKDETTIPVWVNIPITFQLR